MHIVLMGLNHRSAPVALRERLAFSREQLPGAFDRLRREVGLEEAAILSTCNRVEIYGGVRELDSTLHRLSGFLSDHAQVALPGLQERLYSWTEPDSIRHLFAVASGLDSMVLGEGEILHQVKHAYEWARDHGATGKLLNGLFQRALNAAKAVRSGTAIGEGCRSIGGMAVELAGKIFGDVRQATVLLIGAGTVGELTVQRLSERGVRRLRIMNRSADRAARLAAAHQAVAVPLDALADELPQADIVISSASVAAPLLTRDHVAAAMPRRHQRALCLVDLGVPRNIDPAVGALDNVYLFNIDDLQGLVDRSAREREQALRASQAILDEKVDRFLAWWSREAFAAPLVDA